MINSIKTDVQELALYTNIRTFQGTEHFKDAPEDNDECKMKYGVIYEGPVQKVTETRNNKTNATYALLDTDSEKAFMITVHKPKSSCNEQILTTPSPNIFVIESQTAKFSRKKDETVSLHNIDLQMFVSLKILSTYNSLNDNI
ncbi:unnamed protein product [Chironomus riparius]|uniref:Uncharacterized protein n=1 Tax=Chironomus riparius TaxID=315576 RepID=A0A9N9SBD7_9DIPT|nr:unnamed protein product [Chironomus riparius]